MKYERTEVNVLIDISGNTKLVDGFTTEVPGLVIAIIPGKYDNKSKWYSVIHEATGASISQNLFDKLRKAKELVEFIAEMEVDADWTDLESILRFKDNHVRLFKIIRHWCMKYYSSHVFESMIGD